MMETTYPNETGLSAEQLEKKLAELQQAYTELALSGNIEKFTAAARLIRTIAHEIRNPLTNISLATEQIKAEAGDNADMQMLTDMINRNITRINQMLSELSASTKFTPLDSVKLDIHQTLDEVIALVQEQLNAAEVRIEKNYNAADSKIDGDPNKLKTAFLNILVNAIEASDKNSVIEISTEIKNNKLLVDITDKGKGITEEDLIKIFDPYFSKKEKRPGLGLTQAQNIILNHSGLIQVQTSLNEGSSFIISLNQA